MIGYIYKYTFPNGKIYIGQTRTSVKERHYQHMHASQYKNRERATLVEHAIAKYGEPELEVIETIEVNDRYPTELVKQLNEAEKKWIEKYDSTNKRKGYNIQNGGKVITPEEYILEEKFSEIYERERWSDELERVRNILNTIIEKNCNVEENFEFIPFHLKSSDLTKEERKVWYGYEFIDRDGEKQTFNSFVKKYQNFDFFENLVNHAFEDLEINVSRNIWNEIEKKRVKIIKDWYKNN